MCHLISILVRSHNDEAFIGKTLQSVRDQECAVPFEVVCCDDASEDRSAEIIDSFPDVTHLPREMISVALETLRDFRFLLANPEGLPELPGAPVHSALLSAVENLIF